MLKSCLLAFLLGLLPAAAAPPEMVVQLGHTGSVTGVAVTRDGKFALTAGGALLLWDLATGAEIREFRAVKGTTRIALSRDGKVVACGGLNGDVRLLDLERGEVTRVLRERGSYEAGLDFARNADVLVSANTDGQIMVWNTATGERLRTLTQPDRPRAVAISPDGSLVACSNLTSDVTLWSVADGRQVAVLKGHTKAIDALAFSPDGAWLASGSGDRTTRLWQLATFQCVATLPEAPTGILHVAFNGDGTLLATSDGEWTQPEYAVRLWSVPGWKEVRRFTGQKAAIQSVAFSPDGRELLFGHRNTVRRYDPATGAEKLVLRGHSAAVRKVDFSPDGQLLVLAKNSDASARIWDLRLGSEVLIIRGHEPALVAARFSPDGRTLATAGYDNNVRLWDAATGKSLELLKGHGNIVWGLAFSPDGKSVYSASQDSAWARWGIHGSGPRLTKGHVYGLNAIAVSRDGSRVATASTDKTARVWDAGSGKELRSLVHGDEVQDVAFLPGGQLLLTGCQDHHAYLWNVATGEKVQDFPQTATVSAVAVNAAGTRIALGTWDGDLNLLDPATGRTLATCAGGRSSVDSVVFSPDGTRLASGGWDGAAHLWDAATGRELARLYSLDQGWVVVTPEGYFDGSPEGLKAIHWTVGLESYPLDAFSEGSYVPGLLPRLLAGETFAAKGPAIAKGFALPPRVRITSPTDGAGLRAAEVEVKVEAQDQGGGVDEIRLFLNGKALGGEARGIKVEGTGTRTQVFRAVLTEGENRFRAVALSTARIESNPAEIAVTFRGEEAGAALHILVVGIDHYKNESMNLNYARADAVGLADFFAGMPHTLFTRVEERRLLDGEASKAAILASLETLRRVPPQDVVVVYLAGHGDTLEDTWYFLPFELTYPEREEDVKARGLSSRELQAAIRAIGAQKVLVLLDACKSGEALLAFGGGRGVEDRKALAMLGRATGVHIVAASTKDQFATEVRELGHGVFTYTLLQGLQGGAGAGAITVRRLLSYIEEQLPEVSRKYKTQAQYPVVDSRGMDFPLAPGKP